MYLRDAGGGGDCFFLSFIEAIREEGRLCDFMMQSCELNKEEAEECISQGSGYLVNTIRHLVASNIDDHAGLAYDALVEGCKTSGHELLSGLDRWHLDVLFNAEMSNDDIFNYFDDDDEGKEDLWNNKDDFVLHFRNGVAAMGSYVGEIEVTFFQSLISPFKFNLNIINKPVASLPRDGAITLLNRGECHYNYYSFTENFTDIPGDESDADEGTIQRGLEALSQSVRDNKDKFVLNTWKSDGLASYFIREDDDANINKLAIFDFSQSLVQSGNKSRICHSEGWTFQSKGTLKKLQRLTKHGYKIIVFAKSIRADKKNQTDEFARSLFNHFLETVGIRGIQIYYCLDQDRSTSINSIFECFKKHCPQFAFMDKKSSFFVGKGTLKQDFVSTFARELGVGFMDHITFHSGEEMRKFLEANGLIRADSDSESDSPIPRGKDETTSKPVKIANVTSTRSDVPYNEFTNNPVNKKNERVAYKIFTFHYSIFS